MVGISFEVLVSDIQFKYISLLDGGDVEIVFIIQIPKIWEYIFHFSALGVS